MAGCGRGVRLFARAWVFVRLCVFLCTCYRRACQFK